jgi:hypothetical protein
MKRIAAYSVGWGTPTDETTETNRPIISNQQAKVMRDAEWKRLKKEGRNVKRSVLRGQLRQYWGLFNPCGIVSDVYEIYEYDY